MRLPKVCKSSTGVEYTVCILALTFSEALASIVPVTTSFLQSLLWTFIAYPYFTPSLCSLYSTTIQYRLCV